MTVKEWLNRGRKLNTEIDILLREKSRALGAATETVQRLGLEKVQTTPANTSEDKIVDYIAYSEIVDGQINNLYKIKSEILQVINQIDDNVLRTLLLLRYVSCETDDETYRFYSWDEIADKLGYSREWVTKNLHPRALEAVGKILKNLK